MDVEKQMEVQVLHYSALAMTRGWWAYSQQQVIAMESDQSGQWLGIRAAVGANIKRAGYRPKSDELGEWWRV